MSLNWQSYWTGRPDVVDASIDEMLVQVGKTQFGAPVESQQLEVLVAHLAAAVPLNASSSALDLGCGNGLITARLATRVQRVVGLDYSQTLLGTARAYSAAANIAYLQADLRDMSDVALPAGQHDAAWSVEVVQNLDPADLTRLLRWLATVMAPGFRFLASGIPDSARIRNFYNTPERWQLHLDNEAAGRENMGRWWSREEITEAATAAGVAVEILSLPDAYYTSHYRFDALFRGAV